MNLADISMEWFQSAADVTQLAIDPVGGNIIRTGADPVWEEDVGGGKIVTEQETYTLFLLQSSGTSGERADTGEFLRHFKRWIIEMSIKGNVPAFGNMLERERTWATGGSKAADWEGSPPASVYSIQIHKQFATLYEMEDDV